jgi:hypothetical protein
MVPNIIPNQYLFRGAGAVSKIEIEFFMVVLNSVAEPYHRNETYTMGMRDASVKLL